jgi:hypothetical protein
MMPLETRRYNYVIGYVLLVLRSRASGVSKDEADIGASWFETRQRALLTMRVSTQ